MKIKDILNIKNVASFIEGHAKYFYDELVGLPEHQKEQVMYRLSVCKDDCVPNKKCKYCGCPPEKKAFSTVSCNEGERFPDIMSKDKWEEFKKEKGIG